jgi:hypothetical protein
MNNLLKRSKNKDENGRLNRFPIRDIPTRDGIVQPGQIMPVSAHMINHMRDCGIKSFLSKFCQIKIPTRQSGDKSLFSIAPEAGLEPATL